MKSLDSFGKLSLAVLPTPMYRLANVSDSLNIDLYIKRDDMTGVALGGNKVRKLEYLLYDAKAQGCDYVLTTGGAQSNHAMLTAACCRRLGLEPILVLKKRGVTSKRGNLVLDDIFGADVRMVDSDSYDDVYAEMYRVADELRAKGHKPYLVPVGGSVALGSLGYVNCIREVAEAGVKFDHIVCTAGSGGTHAGVALGAKLFMPEAEVIAVGICDDPFEEIVPELMTETAALLDVDMKFTKRDIELFWSIGEGYAIPSPEGNAAIRFMAENEGILLDPVYTGKCFAGLIKLAETGRLTGRTLFIHTGGAGALFAFD